MSFTKGKFFYAVYPSYPLEFSLKQKEVFRATDEFGEDVFAEQTFLLHRNIVFPGFIYRLFSESELVEEIKLNYPVEVTYRREKDVLFIFPVEVKLKEPSLCIYTDSEGKTKKIFSYQLKRNGEKIKLPQEIFIELDKKNMSIVLEQADGTWVLEKNSFSKSKKDVCGGYLRQQKSLRIFSYLSVKNLLNAENGFERLTEDIDKRIFPSSQPQKLGRLLEILRAANYEQEEIILTSIFLDDKFFFEQIQKELFHDDLIPYMNSKELTNVLFGVDDEILKTLENSDQALLEKYRPFISRNRFAKLFGSTYEKKNSEKKIIQTNFEQTMVWQHIQKYFENKKKRLFFLVRNKHKFFIDHGEKNATQNRDRNKTQLQTDEYLNTNSDLFVHLYQDGRLIIEIAQTFTLVCICVEQKKNYFTLFYFQQMPKGTLFLEGLSRLPRRVVLGAIDNSQTLYETFAIYKKNNK